MESITVRRPDLGLENNFKKYYADNNPLLTHIVNSLHVVFPEGEKFFIRAVKKYSDKIMGSKLKENVRAFIGQETQHMSQHERIWDTLESQGISVNEFNAWYKKDAYGKIEDSIKNIFGETTGNKISLAVTCALEHYTATLAEIVITEKDKVFKGFDPGMKSLLLWHASEEIEHKSVAYDVMQQMGISNNIKNIGMVIATWTLFYYSAIGAAKFIKEDSEINSLDIIKSIPKSALLAKLVFGMVPDLIEYFRDDFHPTQLGRNQIPDNYFRVNEIKIA